MFIVVVTRHGEREYVYLMKEGMIYSSRSEAEKDIEKEMTQDLTLNIKQYYKIEPVYIKLK